MNINFDHINMSVSSLKQSFDWYHRVFGFEKVEEGLSDGVRWEILKKNESLLCLYEHPELAAPSSQPSNDHRVSHFGIRVTDRDAWTRIVAQENVKVEYGGAIRYPHSSSWYVVDPSGHEIEVSHWPTR